MQIKIYSDNFDPWQEIQEFQMTLGQREKIGATSIFIGSMRDFNEGVKVKTMLLEHYSGMTEKQLNNIVTEAMQKWQLNDVLVVHRVGDLLPEQPIVLVVVWSSHRGAAFDACRYIMEALKSRAPFWKKERLHTDSERWVDQNTKG